MEYDNDGYKIKITQLESAIRRLERQSFMGIRGHAWEADIRYIAQWNWWFIMTYLNSRDESDIPVTNVV
jgi:hypothetical protein